MRIGRLRSPSGLTMAGGAIQMRDIAMAVPDDRYTAGNAVGAMRRSVELQQMRRSIEMGGRRSIEMAAKAAGDRRASIQMQDPAMRAQTQENIRRSIDLIAKAQEVKQKTEAAAQAAKEGKKVEAKDKPPVPEVDDHQIPMEELCRRYETDLERGLTQATFQAHLQQYGPNALTPAKVTPQWVKWLMQMVTPFAIIMWIAAVLCFIGYSLDRHATDNIILAIALIIVIFATGTFAWYQEKQSGAIMDNFTKMLPTMARVVRDGRKEDVDAVQLVPGDIVEVLAGQKIPADIRIVEAANFKVDNSSLTGETEPQSRSKDCTDPNIFETKNLAFFSTLAVEGTCKGVVVFTGDRTLIGKIASLASGENMEKRKSPIAHEIHNFVIIIGIVAFALGIIFFGVGFKVYGSGKVIEIIVLSIGIIVANVPEGLPATVTMCLTHAAHTMASKNVLVKSLEAVETLGSTSTICSDKTGTLTQNRMTVVKLFYGLKQWRTTDDFDQSIEKFSTSDAAFQMVHKVMCLGSKAVFNPDPENMTKPIFERLTFGDATESAMIKFCESIRNIEDHRAEYPKIMELAFNSKNKFALSIHEDPKADRRFLVMKGAPERIIDRCNRFMQADGSVIPMTADIKRQLNENNENLGGQGMRVLGLCYENLDPMTYTKDYVFDVEQGNYPMDNMIFAGLAALIDPPKETVPFAVAKCQGAGIKVIMVTGDHPVTAAAIAREVGIIKGDTKESIAKRRGCRPEEVKENVPAIVIAGTQIADFKDSDWDFVLGHPEIVFARTTPEQKLIIVDENQKRGAIVAVTGDGVNDSPALKKADIGVAMGISGSDVSKEAAKMVLLDDNFASIVVGVEEGRIIFDNLKKSIAYTLEHLGAEVVPYLISFIAEIPLPITTILILAIDLGTDIFPAISFAYENAESDIMLRPPRNPKVDRLAGWRLYLYAYFVTGVVILGGTLFTYFIVLIDHGFQTSKLMGVAANWKEDKWPVEILCNKPSAENKEDFEKYCTPDCRFPDTADGWTFAPMNSTFVKPVNGSLAAYKCELPHGATVFQSPWMNPEYRHYTQRVVNTAVWFSIVMGQWGGIVACKTRKLSVFTQGMKNAFMNYCLLFEVALSVFLIYTPGIQEVFGTANLNIKFWFTSAPFALWLIVVDEIRKWEIRRNPEGWIAFCTYY
eukprot:tig00000980_g6142.t1